MADPGFLKGGWLTGQNDIGTIRHKIASVIVLFPFLSLSLNDPKEGAITSKEGASITSVFPLCFAGGRNAGGAAKDKTQHTRALSLA